jgi:hypothetical protein
LVDGTPEKFWLILRGGVCFLNGLNAAEGAAIADQLLVAAPKARDAVGLRRRRAVAVAAWHGCRIDIARVRINLTNQNGSSPVFFMAVVPLK